MTKKIIILTIIIFNLFVSNSYASDEKIAIWKDGIITADTEESVLLEPGDDLSYIRRGVYIYDPIENIEEIKNNENIIGKIKNIFEDLFSKNSQYPDLPTIAMR